MKISPIDQNGAIQQPSQVQTFKMTTNATPLPNQSPQQLSISSNNETKAAVEATQPLSPQLALLAKQRRALQQQQRELENQKKALLAQSSGSPGIDVARLKAEPLNVLLEHGVTYQQLADAITNGTGSSEINALKAEIQSLKKGIDQKFVEKDTLAENQALDQIRRDAQRLIAADDRFELVRETNSLPHAVDLIKRTWKQTGELLDVPEALRLVEDELFKEQSRIFKAKKLQALVAPAPAIPQPQQRPVGMRTLTNRDTASVPMSAKARAMAAFYGNLQR